MVHSRLVEAGTDIVVEGEVGDMASKEGMRDKTTSMLAACSWNIQE